MSCSIAYFLVLTLCLPYFRYMAKKPIKHTVIVSYGMVSVPGSPYRVLVQEASNPGKVKVFGPAVDQPCKTFHPTYFMVDCSEAGPGEHFFRLVLSILRLHNIEFVAVTQG